MGASVKAAFAALIGQPFRVVYRNRFDGAMRVLRGGMSHREAIRYMATWGDPSRPWAYMGPETAIQPCDGAADGSILEEAINGNE